MQRLLFIALALFCGCAAAASMAGLTADQARVEVVDCGRYRVLQREPRQVDGATTAGYSSVIATRFVNDSLQVPLRLGEAFGFRFRLWRDDSDQEWLPVQIVIRHPPLLDVHGRRSEGFVLDSAARRDRDGSYRNGAFYVLSDDRELVAGRWRIELVHAGHTLIRREFDLVTDDGRVAGTQLAEPVAWRR